MIEDTKNIYPDEQEKIDDRFQIEMELMLKLEDLLDEYNYELVPKVDSNGPRIDLQPCL